MIVVDGDSVAYMDAATKWPYLLGQSRGLPVVSLAKHKSTARDCLLRSWKALELRPTWYVLCVGQWSQNHEPLDEFEHCLRGTIEAMHLRRIQVCLMTPPVDLGELDSYRMVIKRCARVYRAGLFDLYAHLLRAPVAADWWEADGSLPCHFSAIGAEKVIKFFDLPENAHLCKL